MENRALVVHRLLGEIANTLLPSTEAAEVLRGLRDSVNIQRNHELSHLRLLNRNVEKHLLFVVVVVAKLSQETMLNYHGLDATTYQFGPPSCIKNELLPKAGPKLQNNCKGPTRQTSRLWPYHTKKCVTCFFQIIG